MSDVDDMIEQVAKHMWEEYLQRPGQSWDDMGRRAKSEWLIVAEHALGGVGIPLETLAALKAGAWKAMPVEPTDEMLMAEDKPSMGTAE